MPAPGEARTHGLQIMRLTRCLLRYGGMCDHMAGEMCLPTFSRGTHRGICVGLCIYNVLGKSFMSEGGFEPPPS